MLLLFSKIFLFPFQKLCNFLPLSVSHSVIPNIFGLLLLEISSLTCSFVITASFLIPFSLILISSQSEKKKYHSLPTPFSSLLIVSHLMSILRYSISQSLYFFPLISLFSTFISVNSEESHNFHSCLLMQCLFFPSSRNKLTSHSATSTISVFPPYWLFFVNWLPHNALTNILVLFSLIPFLIFQSFLYFH